MHHGMHICGAVRVGPIITKIMICSVTGRQLQFIHWIVHSVRVWDITTLAASYLPLTNWKPWNRQWKVLNILLFTKIIEWGKCTRDETNEKDLHAKAEGKQYTEVWPSECSRNKDLECTTVTSRRVEWRHKIQYQFLRDRLPEVSDAGLCVACLVRFLLGESSDCFEVSTTRSWALSEGFGVLEADGAGRERREVLVLQAVLKTSCWEIALMRSE